MLATFDKNSEKRSITSSDSFKIHVIVRSMLPSLRTKRVSDDSRSSCVVREHSVTVYGAYVWFTPSRAGSTDEHSANAWYFRCQVKTIVACMEYFVGGRPEILITLAAMVDTFPFDAEIFIARTFLREHFYGLVSRFCPVIRGRFIGLVFGRRSARNRRKVTTGGS